MTEKLKILKKNFNSYCVTLASFMTSISPNETIKIYRDEIIKLDKKESNIIIDTFILNALKYEEQLIEGNELFFMGKSFNELTNNDDNMIMKVFEFKYIWKKINVTNKTQIKNYMKILCQIARVYINLVIEMRESTVVMR